MPNAVYRDRELFEFERDEVFSRTWVALTFTSDAPQERYVYPVDFMGMPVLLVRTEGEFRVYHNVCSHRGMTLVKEAGPAKRVIRCPYHSWSYDLDGDLVSTPHIGGIGSNDVEGFDRRLHGLKEIRSAIWMGVIFINLDGAADEFDSHTESLQSRWEDYAGRGSLNHLVAPGEDQRIDLALNCNWKLPIENYCEAYHLPWIHPGLNSYSPLSAHESFSLDEKTSGQISHQYTLTDIAGLKLPLFSGWQQDMQSHAEYFSFYPNLLLGIQADHAFAIVLMPKAPDRTEERLQLMYVNHEASSDTYRPCREKIIKAWREVFIEDIDAVEGMQKGRESSGFDGGTFSPVMDTSTHHFHRWVAKRYLSALADVKY